MSPPPVLVIGTGRSGTNLLAHVLDADPRFHNRYENRYIWNYRAHTWAHDRRGTDEATPATVRYIRRFFERAGESGQIVVDKTPSNVFRLPFIRAVLPEARVIHLIRDGRDNLISREIEWYGGRQAYRREGAEAVAGRLALLKQRLGHFRDLVARGNVPRERLPAFFADNAQVFLSSLLTRRPRRYGERFPGMRETLQAYGHTVTTAVQWREGVMQALHALRDWPSAQYLELRYEELSDHPEASWSRIAHFLEIAAESPAGEFLVQNVRRGNHGKWRTALSSEQLSVLEPHIRPTLEYLGYTWA